MKHTNYQFSESYCTLLPNNLYLKNTEEDNCTMYVLAYHDNPKRKKGTGLSQERPSPHLPFNPEISKVKIVWTIEKP